MKRYGIEPGDFNDDLAWLGAFFEPWRTSWTIRGQFVDTEKYDIVPRPEYRRSLIEKKEEEIKRLQEREKEIQKEIESLKDDK